MAEHPAVAHLTAAHQRAVEAARAVTETAFCGDGRWIAKGPFGDDSSSPRRLGLVQSECGEDILGQDEDLPWEFADHIALNDPASVLRRVEAERRILDQHSPTAGCGYLPYVPGRPLGDAYGTIDPACTSCGTDDEYAVPWPCATVLALAAGWGWEGERHG